MDQENRTKEIDLLRDELISAEEGPSAASAAHAGLLSDDAYAKIDGAYTEGRNHLYSGDFRHRSHYLMGPDCHTGLI